MYCKLKNSSYFAVLWTIFQSILHSYICLINILMHFCQFLPTTLHLTYYIYFTYLYNHKCLHNLQIDFGHELIYPISANLSNVTEILLKLYLILDGLMIVTAVALLCGAFFNIKGIWVLLYYFPWVITMGTSITLDVFSLFKYVPHLFESMSTRSWLEYVGFDEIPKEIGSEFDSRFWNANLYAVLFFARFGATFVNFIFFVNVTRIAINAYKEDEERNVVDVKNQTTNNNNASSLIRSFRNAEERIRRWQEFYGDVESQESFQMNDINDKTNNVDGFRCINTSDDYKLRCNMPFSYTNNLQDIPNVRSRLSTVNLHKDSTMDNKTNNLNVSLSDEAETTF